MTIGKGFLRGLFAILISPFVVLYYAIMLVYSIISFPIKSFKYLINYFMGVNPNEPDEETKLLNKYKQERRKILATGTSDIELAKQYANRDELDEFIKENAGDKHE